MVRSAKSGSSDFTNGGLGGHTPEMTCRGVKVAGQPVRSSPIRGWWSGIILCLTSAGSPPHDGGSRRGRRGGITIATASPSPAPPCEGRPRRRADSNSRYSGTQSDQPPPHTTPPRALRHRHRSLHRGECEVGPGQSPPQAWRQGRSSLDIARSGGCRPSRRRLHATAARSRQTDGRSTRCLAARRIPAPGV